ncbi:MAG TPA: phospholipase D-like domain-containing protein [Burkholderiaceae bacterium]|nr:phospholipase D-like domain-containing protein [Burkholderiaceae bacterium]
MTTFQALFDEYWPHLVLLLSITVGSTAAVHAAMTKSDVRAAIAWVGVIIMSPLLGPFIYLIAGINRIRHDHISDQRDRSLPSYIPDRPLTPIDVAYLAAPQFKSLHQLSDNLSRFPLVDGNNVRILRSGDEAYPAMIDAIESAERTIALETYIFDNDMQGKAFVAALARARQRGVEIRVLIDAVGVRYSQPSITWALRRNEIPYALFMTNPMGIRTAYANLRSHRKILVVDGRLGFTGGMNIRENFVSTLAKEKAANDTHFQVEGPVVAQLMAVFAHDWEFTTREALPFEKWIATDWDTCEPHIAARCIHSGPDRYMASTHSLLLGAFAVAQHHIRIQSPYFLPDQVLLGAINTAARRGVLVDIVIPGQNNLRLVNYAMTAQLDQVVRAGCRVWRTAGVFNHSKLTTIDGAWSLIGSSNLDPRSLRLNFELDMEIYSRSLARRIEDLIDLEIAHAELVTLESLAAIPFRKRLRNRVIWLASPYL